MKESILPSQSSSSKDYSIHVCLCWWMCNTPRMCMSCKCQCIYTSYSLANQISTWVSSHVFSPSSPSLPSPSLSSSFPFPPLSPPSLYLPLPTSLSLIRNGMLREAQLSTRNMVNAVTEEFWKMVRGSISDQALHFKSTLYMLVVIIIILNFHFQCINHPIKKY